MAEILFRHTEQQTYGVRRTEAWEWMVELPVLAKMGGAHEEGRRGVQETYC